MPKLLEWCDEAAYVHWSEDNLELPDWREAQDGKLSKVYYPSPAQVAKQIADHETYHVGQVAYLREWLGYGQSVG